MAVSRCASIAPRPSRWPAGWPRSSAPNRSPSPHDAAASPAAVGPDGLAQCGRYQGLAGAPGWANQEPPAYRSALWRRLHHKRWHVVALVTDEVFCGVAIVDIGRSNTRFAYAFDRRERRIAAAFSPLGVAGLTATVGDTVTGGARFSMPGRRIAIEAQGEHDHRLVLRAGRFRIDAAYAGAGPRLLAIGPVVDGGSVHGKQKPPGVALCGQLQAGGRSYTLDGGVAATTVRTACSGAAPPGAGCRRTTRASA